MGDCGGVWEEDTLVIGGDYYNPTSFSTPACDSGCSNANYGYMCENAGGIYHDPDKGWQNYTTCENDCKSCCTFVNKDPSEGGGCYSSEWVINGKGRISAESWEGIPITCDKDTGDQCFTEAEFYNNIGVCTGNLSQCNDGSLDDEATCNDTCSDDDCCSWNVGTDNGNGGYTNPPIEWDTGISSSNPDVTCKQPDGNVAGSCGASVSDDCQNVNMEWVENQGWNYYTNCSDCPCCEFVNKNPAEGGGCFAKYDAVGVRINQAL